MVKWCVRLLRHYPFSLLCIAIIWFACFDDPKQMPSVSVSNIDKLVHCGFYLGTCSTIWWEYLRYHGRARFAPLFWGGFVAPVFMSTIIEVLQGQTNYRGADVFDLLANTIGAALAALFGYFILRPIYTDPVPENK